MPPSPLLPLGLGTVLLAGGLLTFSGSMIAAALPLLLIVVIRSVSSPPSVATQLELHRVVDRQRASEGDEIEVTLTLRNDGPTIALLAITDTPPPGMPRIRGYSRWLGRLAAGERQEIIYTVLARRGRHRFGPPELRSWSPWTLAAGLVAVGPETRMTVHPRIESLDPITLRPRRTRAFAGPIRASRGGQGLDFFGCRAYTPGDDIRRINWRAYARQDALILNDYELERIADVNVVLDARASSHARLGAETTFDYAVRAAASLSDHFLSQGNSVGLLIYGDTVQWVYPGIGRRQRERILDELADAGLGDKAPFEELRSIPTRLFPVRSQLVIVSPLSDEDDTEVIAMLVDRGYAVFLVCPHSVALPADLTSEREAPATELAQRIVSLKRELFLGSLAGFGASVVDWPVEKPLRTACRGVRRPRFRGRRRR